MCFQSNVSDVYYTTLYSWFKNGRLTFTVNKVIDSFFFKFANQDSKNLKIKICSICHIPTDLNMFILQK